MRAIETSAVFDENGQITIKNLPLIINKNVKLLILFDEDPDETELYTLSQQGLSEAYSENEPDYDFSLIKEPNPYYKNGGR